MIFLEVLLEGSADQPVVQEILQRRFRLQEGQHFRIHPHKGKGRLPQYPNNRPDPKHRGLLDQLPAKLRGYSSLPKGWCVIVLVDADEDDCKELKARMLRLTPRPRCLLIRIAVEETESWFLADANAIKKAYPKAKLNKLPNTPPDSKIGAWENLAKTLGKKPQDCTGQDKYEWSTRISPELNLDSPQSPSLLAFINGVDKLLSQQ